MPDRTAAFLQALSRQGGAPTIAPPPTIARPKPAAAPFSLPIEAFDPFDPNAPAKWIEQAGQPARSASSAPAELGQEAIPAVAMAAPAQAPTGPGSPAGHDAPTPERAPEAPRQPAPFLKPPLSQEVRDSMLDLRADLIGVAGESSEDELSPGARLVLLILGLSVGGAVLLLAVQLLG